MFSYRIIGYREEWSKCHGLKKSRTWHWPDCVLCWNTKVHLTDLLTRRTWGISNIWVVWSKKACDCSPRCPSSPAASVKIATSVSSAWMMTLERNIHLSFQCKSPRGCCFFFIQYRQIGDYYRLKNSFLSYHDIYSIVSSEPAPPNFHRAAVNIKLAASSLTFVSILTTQLGNCLLWHRGCL